MSMKVVVFIVKITLGFFIGIVTLVFGAIFGTSMQVACELQSDNTYNCEAHDTLLGFQITDIRAENVIKLEDRLNCSGIGSKRGCSHPSDFVTFSGERIQLSTSFTSSEKQVRNMVESINVQMQTKTTPIRYESGTSLTLILAGCLAAFIFLYFVLQAFLGLRSSVNEPVLIVSGGNK